MNKIKKEEMDLTKTADEILRFFDNLSDDGKGLGASENSIKREVNRIIKKNVVNILEPECVYEKGKYYDGLGKYIGIVDTHPYGADYYVKNHHFAVMPSKGAVTGGNVAHINKVKIREIKK